MNTYKTRSMPCRTLKTEPVMSSAQPFTRTNPVLTINQNPGGHVAGQVKKERLPLDWIKEVKTRKKDSSRKDVFHVDPKSGYAFRSLKDALRYLKTGDILSCALAPQKRSMEEIKLLVSQTVKSESAMSSAQPSNLINDGDHKLLFSQRVKTESAASPSQPSNLINDRKPSNHKLLVSRRVKTESAVSPAQPSNLINEGKPGDHKLLVSRRVKTESAVSPAQPSNLINEGKPGDHKLLFSQRVKTESAVSPAQPSNLINDGKPGDHVAREDQFTSHGLPKNWIKELKPRKNGSPMMDPYYIDPETGYAFCSLKDALRYLRSGDIRSCMVRPKKRSMEEVQALMSSSEMTTISGMKTVRRDSSELVQSETLHRKRKRTNPVKPSDLKPNEEVKTKGTDSTTGNTLRRVKRRREGPVCVRASPRLLALKAKIEPGYDENHEENNEMSNAVSGALHSPGPQDLNQKPKEDVMAGTNDSSTGTQLQRGKMLKERPTPVRASSRLAALTATTDAASVENNNSTMSNAVSEPSLSPSPYLNGRPSSQPDLELKEEIIGASGSSTGTPLRGRKMRKERPMPLRASSRLATLKETTDTTSVGNENSMTSNPVFEPSPLLTRQPDPELKEDTIEGESGSSAGTPLQRGKKRGKRPTPLRASPHVAAQKERTGATSVENENSMTSNGLFEPSRPLSNRDVQPTSQPDLDLKVEKIEGANGSSTRTLSRRRKRRIERPVPIRASSRLAALKATTDFTSDENGDNNRSNTVSEPSPSPRPDLNLGPTSQPDLESKEEMIVGPNGRGNGTILQRGKLHSETPVRASSGLSALKSTMEAASDENKEKNNTTSNAVSELPLSPACPDLNLGPASQPHREPKVETIASANGSTTGMTSWRVEPRREMPTFVRASPYNAQKVTYPVSEPSHFRGCPDLNFGPTGRLNFQSQGETIRANGSATGPTLWRVKQHSERCTPVKAITEAASYNNHEENNERNNYFWDLAEPPVSQITMGPTSQPNTQEMWLSASTAAPSSMIGEVKAPDLNMVPMTWPAHQSELERALEPNIGPILEQPQQPAGVDMAGLPSEMPYQDPTMDALLSGQEAGPSIPHMSVDPLHSPFSPYFGDFWHDPCLSYAFKTLTGDMDEQQLDLGLGPDNYVNGAGARNGGPSENPSIGPCEPTSRTLQSMNNGIPFPK